MRPKSGAAFKGYVRTLGVDTTRLPPGTKCEDFEDLFYIDEDGAVKTKYPEAVSQDHTFENKFLKRAISYLFYRALYGHAGATANQKNLSDISYGNTTNPFQALIFVGDSDAGNPPTRPGDAKVVWSESDNQFNDKIPSGNGSAGLGIRGVLLSATTGTLKRVQVRYPTTSPYRGLEYTFFAQANSPAIETTALGLDNFPIKSIGLAAGVDAGYNGAASQWGTRAVLGEYPSCQCGTGAVAVLTPGANFTDTQTVTIGGKVYTFLDTVGTADGNVHIGVDLTETLSNFKAAINLETNGGKYGSSTVVHPQVSCASCNAATLTINSKWLGGTTISLATDRGSWDASTMTAIFKGKNRKYCHENYIYSPIEGGGKVTALHRYTGVEDVGTYGEGYVSSNEPSDTSLLSYTGKTLTFTAATNRIQIADAVLTSAHIRKTLIISNTASWDGAYTIKRIVSGTDTVEVFEDITSSGSEEGDAVVYTRTTGDKCFDGRVENYGKVYQYSYDQDISGAIVHGEKWVSDTTGSQNIGRVWATDKSIKAIRIVCADGIGRENVPSTFVIQYLKQYHTGTSDPPRPADDGDWVTYTGLNFSASDQSSYIFSAGRIGYEYTVASPVATKGIRVSSINSYGGFGYSSQIATLMLAEEGEAHSITAGSNVLKASTADPASYVSHTIPEVTSTTDLTEIRDALIAVLHGWELEAVINDFGFLIVRGTVAGKYSHIDIDSIANGSSINSSIGLPASGYIDRTGETRASTKLSTEAMVYIYTVELAGDYPEE